ncbi:hypothetical protein [Thermaerobacillus caldiproteolyticus]|uniref:Uncharacterized protein n=1 Tax=Thermaerobacillus caldiproteolyticus TaxID=247480 RepID=A0A7V9Z903_9BACL|nr:hypothetical protein [Anoxybacillus caldiproteolyticus]MBA2876288.1 hypothetical protein [Anoxybacillus caldiproteolyticus]QPA31106.1 hypothetical protein ISX45_16630 [Anoxybacillus caldiproteolyticus]
MILLDTIAYNTFLDIVRGRNPRKIKDLNEEKFKNFIMDYEGEKFIHSATLFEIYMKDLKSSDFNNFNKFVDDFNALKKYNIKILNESTWNFDWQSLATACENDEPYDMGVYIESKVEYEVTSISRYFMYILLIVCDKLFDTYGDEVGIELFNSTMAFNRTLIDSKLKEYLLDYYLTDQKKEISSKKFDVLLGYIIDKLENIIKNRLTIKNMFERPENFLSKQYYDYEKIDQLSLSGVQKAKEILKGIKGKELNKLISNKIDEFEAQVIREGRRFLTPNEKIYFNSVLLPKALQQGYKVTKNDFTDCCIFSAFDCIEKGDKGVVITFDGVLRNLMKEKGIYYDEGIYKQIFN